MLVLEGLVGLCRTVQFTFFSITGRGIDLDYCDIEWFSLEIIRDPSVVFEIASGSFFKPPVAGDQKASLASLSL